VDRQLFWVDRKGATTPVGLPPGLYNDIRISPDGTRIAVLVGSTGSGDVWVYDTHSTAFTRLTFDQMNGTPWWSRDGKSLYYGSLKPTGEETRFFRRPIDGSRDAEQVGKADARAFIDSIDSAEKTMYLDQYSVRTGSNVDVVSLPLGGGSAAMLAGGRGNQAASAISPDGRWLAYQSDEAARADIYVRDLQGAGGRWQVSTTGGEEPHWSSDGSEIFYRNDTRLMSATVAPRPEFRSNPPTVLFDGIYNLRSDTGITYDVDLKTGRFLMLRPAGQTPGAPAARVRVIVNWRR
jgi:eukaryotic-like serine/threonine-protein kinase